jgi:membrane-associated HD superfamily phosphohydrolase
MQQLQMMNQEVSTIKGRYEQEEQQRLMNEINRVAQDVERFPHFEELREQMAQLLEKGLASDLETAYAKSVRLNDDVWQQEQNRLLQQVKQDQIKAQKVAKAKAAAVSPKSVTPNGTVGNSGDKKDRRSVLAEQMSQTDSRF